MDQNHHLVFLQRSWLLVWRGGGCGGLGGRGLVPGGWDREVNPWHNVAKIELSLSSLAKNPCLSLTFELLQALFSRWPVVRSLSVLSVCNSLNFSLLKWQRILLSRWQARLPTVDNTAQYVPRSCSFSSLRTHRSTLNDSFLVFQFFFMCQESVLILLARLGLVCKIDLNRLECLNSSRTASAADMLPRNFDDETHLSCSHYYHLCHNHQK